MKFSPISRRALLSGGLAVAAGAPLLRAADKASDHSLRMSVNVDDTTVRIHSRGVERAVKILMIADTHLFRDDERGAPFRQFSGRMARAYNQTKHFRTGQVTNPELEFVASLEMGKRQGVDLVVLNGDIVSFPSESAIEWLQARLAEAGLPFLYIAGNHDWHYEGMDGSLEELRAIWTEKTLKPLYQGAPPLMHARDHSGVRVVVIDNSTYQIQPEQLAFFKAQLATGFPLLLFVHIPLYAPGRSVGFGCGHPEWGAATDRNFEIERRPRWPAEGHSAATMEFHQLVFSAPNLLGVFAGHTHSQSLDLLNGTPQIVSGANANGASITAEILPTT
jgi:hypothetical protein